MLNLKEFKHFEMLVDVRADQFTTANYALSKNFFKDMDDSMLCGDLLFSGHTLAMVVSTLTIAYYLPDRLKILRFLFYSALFIHLSTYQIETFFFFFDTF